ncbi:hypothetical protein ACET3Z_005397 [Daucus carota]
MSYLTANGFKTLASTYLDIKHQNWRFRERAFRKRSSAPAQVAEELMKNTYIDHVGGSEYEPPHLTFPVAEAPLIGIPAQLETGGHSPVHAHPRFLHHRHAIVVCNKRVGVSRHRLHALFFLHLLWLYYLISMYTLLLQLTRLPEKTRENVSERVRDTRIV